MRCAVAAGLDASLADATTMNDDGKACFREAGD
jgi:hypothetical protein